MYARLNMQAPEAWLYKSGVVRRTPSNATTQHSTALLFPLLLIELEALKPSKSRDLVTLWFKHETMVYIFLTALLALSLILVFRKARWGLSGPWRFLVKGRCMLLEATEKASRPTIYILGTTDTQT
jgi:hypothetical protein